RNSLLDGYGVHRQLHSFPTRRSSDLTSNNILQRVKRIFNAEKAGHSGTLDPMATGMLPICFGEATKFAGQLLDNHKTYQFTCQLDRKSTRLNSSHVSISYAVFCLKKK